LKRVKSLQLGGVYVDVGSNIGNHTIFFAKYCNSKEVISLELSPLIYDVLVENVDDNSLNDKVRLYNIGVGEKIKNVNISDIDEDNVGMTKIVDDDGDITIDTLDNILENIDYISLIKIDVEGYETNVVKGSIEVIKKHSPVIIAELRTDDEFEEFESFISEYGYYTDKVSYTTTPTYFWFRRKYK
jgi:FkbM family methyltransferase